MERVIKGYEPDAMFGFFEEISAIPRGSGNEGAIASYLCDFAKERGLEYRRDEYNNVIIKKPATKRYEGKEPVMLQGHTDMVCEKDDCSDHDFTKDGIKLIEEKGFLHADHTTLGGDDGAAVAMMLYALDSKKLSHPELQCVFTSSEETGMFGANGIDVSDITARRIINLDSEDEGIAVVSCAGSMNTTFTLDPERVPFAGKAIKINISDLYGGHSGGEIHRGRTNAVILMGTLLSKIYEKQPFCLISFAGGNKRNAIPRSCEAVIAVTDRDMVSETVMTFTSSIRADLCPLDRNVKIRVSRCPIAERGETMFTYKDTGKVLSFLALLPNGVITMSQNHEGLVESSSNVGIAKMKDTALAFDVYSRSSSDAAMDAIRLRLVRLAKVTGFDYYLEELSGGWNFNPNSRLQGDYVASYEKLFGVTPRVEGIHAGLECGVFISKMGGGDAISIGPQMRDIHTPKETLDLHSAERTWKLLEELLKM